MGGKKTATPKSKALGTALREARVSAGHESLTKFATLVGKTAATLSRWENGLRTPRPENVAQILTLLGITGDPFEELLAMSRDADASAWLAVAMPEQRRQLDALLRYERDARHLTSVGPLLVPGWLQTPSYARAIMTAGGVPDGDIETRIAIRLGRREVLRNAELSAYIGQATLMQHLGGKDVLRDQLEHLLSQSEKVSLRVIPFAAGWHPALEGPWHVIQSAQESTVVFMENRRSGLFLHEEADIAFYMAAVDSIRKVAMSPDESVGIIAAEINNLRR